MQNCSGFTFLNFFLVPQVFVRSFFFLLNNLGFGWKMVIQDPMRGGSDQMFEDLIAIVHANDPDAIAKDATAPPRRRLVPEFLLKLAHNVSPF